MSSIITLSAVQAALAGKCSPEQCIEPFEAWDKLRKNGETLLGQLESFMAKQQNDFSEAFPSVVAAIEEWFHPDFNQHKNENYDHISPIMVALYDLLLSLKRSYENKSAISCAILTRSVFEMRVNLAEIFSNPDVLSKQFSKYKIVAKDWHEYRTHLISKDELKTRLQAYPEWYDSDWEILEKKRKNWNARSHDNLFEMAKRNNLETEYRGLYGTTSAFIHISPLISNFYSVNGKGPICSEEGVFQITYIGLANVIDAFSLALKIIGLDGDEAKSVLDVSLVVFRKLKTI